MIYKSFQNNKLPALGLGCMRLPLYGEKLSNVDQTAVENIVAYSMEQGMNYFDTAWGYHDGQSEIIMGKVLSKYPRESYLLTDKFPGYDLSNMDKVEEIFEEQLKKCRVDYFDFYMFHNVCESNLDAYLDEKYGIFDYLTKQKEKGRIRHLGFSAHGDYDVMKKFLEHYGKSMEFCQIQLNYLDWTFQKAKEKVELLNEYNIPVFVMEPLRGGALASLPKEHEEKLNLLRPDESIPAWAFRFSQSIPNVALTLSGMSNMEQLQANIHTYENEKPLNDTEFAELQNIAKSMIEKSSVPCTACKYCTSYCPQNIDIPYVLNLYNEHCYTMKQGLFAFIAPMALAGAPKEKLPSSCIACRVCEKVCPQNIKISEAMTDFAEKLG